MVVTRLNKIKFYASRAKLSIKQRLANLNNQYNKKADQESILMDIELEEVIRREQEKNIARHKKEWKKSQKNIS